MAWCGEVWRVLWCAVGKSRHIIPRPSSSPRWYQTVPLQSLFIHGNPLTVVGVEKICEAATRWPKLSELRVGGNNLVRPSIHASDQTHELCSFGCVGPKSILARLRCKRVNGASHSTVHLQYTLSKSPVHLQYTHTAHLQCTYSTVLLVSLP